MKEKKVKLNENEEQNIPVDINRYQDSFTPSAKKLDLGLWLIERGKYLRAGLIIFLIILAVMAWSRTIYGFAYYITKGMNEDEILVREMVAVQTIGHDYILSLSANDLVYSPVQVLRANGDKYDFVGQIENPNSGYSASFNYCFFEQNQEIECDESFVFPGETKNLLSLAKPFNYIPRDVNFIIKDIIWRRINNRQFPDWKNYRDGHLNIVIEGAEFKPSQASGLSEKLNLNTLKFTATNKTPFNYWEVSLTILLYSGNAIAGVNKYILTEFMSGEKQTVEMSWLGNLSGVDNIKIIPEVNILDNNVYIKYEGGIGEEK